MLGFGVFWFVVSEVHKVRVFSLSLCRSYCTFFRELSAKRRQGSQFLSPSNPYPPPSSHSPPRLTAESLNVKYYANNPRSAIMVDFCYFNLMFAKENDFTDEQTSGFYSIMMKVFISAVDDGLSSTNAFDLFKKLILTHSIDDVEAVELYPLPLVKKISSYVSSTFFRYLDAYKYVFSIAQAVVTETKELQVETPLIPQLLAEASSEEDVVVFEEEGGEEEGKGGEGKEEIRGEGEGEGIGEVFELSV